MLIYNTYHYPFGIQMVSRVFEGEGYRYSFNGKERDTEGMGGSGSTYDYGFRIYNPNIAKFLSIDPLTSSYPWYTPYQFAGNTPIMAIDLDGLEEKIVVYQEDNKGNNILIKNITYEDVKDYGPLGNGTYTVHLKTDGTFAESYTSGENNSIPSFGASNIKQARWKGEGKYEGFENRLNARLIQKTAENVLIGQGHDASQVRQDVQILQSDDTAFKGKFATFKEGTADKYTSDWKDAKVSPAHKSISGKETENIENSGVALKYYDGAASLTDNVPNQIGFVRTGFIGHGIEAVRAIKDSNVNINAENATKVKNDIETKPK